MSGSMFGSWFVPQPQSQPDLGSDINPDVNRLWAAMQSNPVGTSQLNQQTAGPATPIDPVAGRWNGHPVTQGQMDALPANVLTGQLNPAGMDVVNGTLGMMGGIKAYHGSPHSFDAFSLGKIGTGEGAQAYGHGLYFADNEGVARSYRDALSANPSNPAWNTAKWAMDETGNNVPAAVQKVKDSLAWLERNGTVTDAIRDKHQGAIQQLQTNGLNGHMYEVNINSNPDHFLDWDKPLSQQSQAVQGLARSADISAARGATKGAMMAWREGRDVGMPATGKTLHNAISDYGNNGAAAAEQLKAAGIPGIRYLDGGSRGIGEGSRNTVVFDPATIEILRKYGVAGLTAGGAGAATALPFGVPQQ